MLRRILIGCTVAVITVAMFAPMAQAHRADWRWRHCRFESRDGQPGYTIPEVKLTIRCAVERMPVSGGVSYAMYIAHRESGFHPYALNASSQACGIYQHIQSYWPGRESGFDRSHPNFRLSDRCTDARINILTSIWMAHRGGWGPWGG